MKKDKFENKEGLGINTKLYFTAILIVFSIFIVNLVLAANPVSPTSVNVINNETKNTSAIGPLMNLSGGYVSTINISALTQNPHWKGLVGYLSGKFSLDDATGATIYDWSLASIGGEVYATRNATTISWSNVNCANLSHVESENTAMNQTNIYDNITATFNGGNSHPAISIGSSSIGLNQCNYTLNTYVNNITSSDFDEVILYAPGSTVYASILEDNVAGFDGNLYDFQMIVPEKGIAGYTGSTAYYLYVKIN